MGRPEHGGGRTSALERLLALEPAESDQERSRLVVAESPDEEQTWLVSNGWRLFARPRRQLVTGGEEIAQFALGDGSVVTSSLDRRRRQMFIPFSPEEAYGNYVAERWKSRSTGRALSPRQLNAYYKVKRFIPRSAQIRARRMFIRRQGVPLFPDWPLDSSVSRLVRFYGYCMLLARGETQAEFRWFWPAPFNAAAILTHDVESKDGLRLAIELADLEEELGFRSSFNLGGWYDVDRALLAELTSRGFEIGVHGLRHDRSLFSSRAEFEAQKPRLANLAERLGAVGFRSPSTHRVFEWLGELPFSYDCSMPHSDPFEPQPGGCCSLWPFLIDDVVELPYTLPQDHTLFTLLGYRSPQLWLEQVDRIAREFGLIQALTHPDRAYLGRPLNRDRYREFLVALSERGDIWKPLPRELAAWWRLRDEGAEDPRAGRGMIHIGETSDEVELQPPTQVKVSESSA